MHTFKTNLSANAKLHPHQMIKLKANLTLESSHSPRWMLSCKVCIIWLFFKWEVNFKMYVSPLIFLLVQLGLSVKGKPLGLKRNTVVRLILLFVMFIRFGWNMKDLEFACIWQKFQQQYLTFYLFMSVAPFSSFFGGWGIVTCSSYMTHFAVLFETICQEQAIPLKGLTER